LEPYIVQKETEKMCVAIPAKIVKIENGMGIVDMEGTRMEVSLLLQEDAMVGDYVIVHAGFAIQKVDEEAAKESIRVLREIVSELDDKEKENEPF
jgi:hydrogenase expression/formation protein HypC